MDPSVKRGAYLFAKDFKFENVLANLQGYRIATGQVEKGEFEALSKKYGSDEGALFGSLITSASGKSNEADASSPPLKRRRRRRRRKTRNKADSEDCNSTTDTISKCNLDQPLTIPSSILDYGSSDSSTSDNGDRSSPKSPSDERSSSESEPGAKGGFFGLTGDSSDEDTNTSLLTSRLTDRQGTSALHTNVSEREHQQSEFFSSAAWHQRPEVLKPEWNPEKVQFSERVSELSSYKCWKCRRIGHLAEDCTVRVGAATGRRPHETRALSSLSEDDKMTADKASLNDFYRRCRELRQSKNAMCTECGGRSNLANCLECGLTLCDGKGHLTRHLMEFPSHTKLYSFKLKKMIKCHKPTCAVVDITKLMMCASCLGKQFDGHYSMINATWSRSGLKGLPSTIACDQHFHWHRMNCANSSDELLVTPEKLELSEQQGDGLLSEFYF
ncbi:uncharacterized protein LOC116612557 [Nematostella vectensis]|uniref:uncharacterized protein LOC116612557 n=1 Tax=Nematostella vectensis TaxID=45351 RepID=UPI0020771AA5|nr:uncharacterized protein LOC116612557 [Nematostella vectensis]